MPPHLRVQRGAPEAEDLGRGLLVPAGGLERPDDGNPLDLLERSGRRGRPFGGAVRLERFRQVGQGDHMIAGQHEHMPLEDRTVIELRYLLGMSGEETAAAMGRSHASTRKLLSMAGRIARRGTRGAFTSRL